MFRFKKKETKTLMEQANENLAKRPHEIAKQLIKMVDADLLTNTKKGYGYGSIFHQRYDAKVDDQVLNIMREYYENQGFKVKVDYPSNVGSNSLKEFTIRCD